jgi:hypothetical protein
MADYVTDWSTIDFPATVRAVDETLQRFGLPQTHAASFGVLVALLVGTAQQLKKRVGHTVIRFLER